MLVDGGWVAGSRWMQLIVFGWGMVSGGWGCLVVDGAWLAVDGGWLAVDVSGWLWMRASWAGMGGG